MRFSFSWNVIVVVMEFSWTLFFFELGTFFEELVDQGTHCCG